MKAPEICPRCGNHEFATKTISLTGAAVPAMAGEVRAGVMACTSCQLGFDGRTWRDADGSEWTMAESGT